MTIKFLLKPSILAMTVIALSGCGSDSDEVNINNSPGDSNITKKMSLTSSAFAQDGTIPKDYACLATGGKEYSPPLNWNNIPEGTKGFAVVMDDETPPCGKGEDACVHWNVYNIPNNVNTLQENQNFADIKSVIQGKNYMDTNLYAGMCPPNKHTYNITVYALKQNLPIVLENESISNSKFSTDYSNYILEKATLSGTYTPQ